jgi:hypothetical protein
VGAFADLFNQLDADDRVKGKQFEHICTWFLTNALGRVPAFDLVIADEANRHATTSGTAMCHYRACGS